MPDPLSSAARMVEIQRLAEREAEAAELLEYALNLRVCGERAPGGTETWREFDRRTEAFLRRRSGGTAVPNG